MLGQQYDSMDCKPYSTAKYYEAYRPDVPGLVPGDQFSFSAETTTSKHIKITVPHLRGAPRSSATTVDTRHRSRSRPSTLAREHRIYETTNREKIVYIYLS